MGTSNGSMVNTAAPAGAGEGPGAHASEAQCVRIRPWSMQYLTDSPACYAWRGSARLTAARRAHTHKTTCTAPTCT